MKKNILLVFLIFVLLFNISLPIAYAEHSDYFTSTAVRKNTNEYVINIVTKKEMTNCIVTLTYLDANEKVLGVDVQTKSVLNANTRYSYHFAIDEILTSKNISKIAWFSYTIDYNENHKNVDTSRLQDFPTVSHSGSLDTENSAFENFMLDTFGDNWQKPLIYIICGFVALCILSSIIKSHKKR